MYALILTLFMFAKDGYSGQGGASVDVTMFDTKLECERVKKAFLSMTVTTEELTGSSNTKSRITRKAECVLIR